MELQTGNVATTQGSNMNITTKRFPTAVITTIMLDEGECTINVEGGRTLLWVVRAGSTSGELAAFQSEADLDLIPKFAKRGIKAVVTHLCATLGDPALSRHMA